MNKIIFLVVFLSIIMLFGKNLNPFSNSMFTFHDETQPARIQQFVLDLRNLQIPPRLAPDFSFKMGYPVFNFYAPASYWITSVFSLGGFDTVNALKLSFLLSILIGFIAAYLFLREHFDFFPSLTGAVLYISSLYYPLDIFVRGNLGEVWFLALSPLALFCIERNAKKSSRLFFFFSALILSLLFTVHNLLSAVSVILIFIFIILRPHKKVNFIALFFGLALSSYFLIPMILENHLTYASYVATLTKYTDHFVCPSQLWQSDWRFGGSTPGCVDGMSFKIGKLQLVLGGLGILRLLLNVLKRKKITIIPYFLFFILLTLGSLFMSTYLLKPVWDLFSPVLALFQFPWRFIAFGLIGLVFFSSYFFQNLHVPFKNILQTAAVIFIFVISSKYFAGMPISKQAFERKYLSKDYIEKKVAYKIAEYLPRTADYNAWRKYEKSSPPDQTSVNIHYFPFWKIYIDNQPYIPTSFDELGRPFIDIQHPSIISVRYQQTAPEMAGNIISIAVFIGLLFIVMNKKLWKKINS